MGARTIETEYTHGNEWRVGTTRRNGRAKHVRQIVNRLR